MMKKVIKKLLAALLAVAHGVRHGDPRRLQKTVRGTSTHITLTALSRSSRVMLRVMILKTLRFPTLRGAATSLIILPLFWTN